MDPSDSLCREQKAKRAIRINRFLSETLLRLAQGNDLRAAIDCIFIGLARELGAAHVFLFRHDPAAHTIRLESSYIDGRLRSGPSGEEMALWGEPFPDDITPAWKIMTEQRGLFTPDMAPISAADFAWPGAFEYAARFELSDIGHIVLFAGSVPVGSIGIGLRGGRKITAEDKQFIEEVANQAAVAIRILDLAAEAKQSAVAAALTLEQEAASRDRAAELSKANDAMRQAIESLAIEPDLISFAGRLLMIIAQQFGAPVVEYWIHESAHVATLKLTCRDGRLYPGSDMKEDPRVSGIMIPEEMIGVSDLYTPRPHFLNDDLPNDPIQQAVFAPIGLDLASWCGERGVRKHLNVALLSGDRSFGALVIYVPAEQQFTDVRIELAYALAHQMTLAIRLTDLALESQRATIAKEREDAALGRAAELAKANKAITDGLRRMATESDVSRMPGMILLEVCKHAGADACCWLDYDSDHDTLNLALRSRQGLVSDQAGPNDPPIFLSPFASGITPAFKYLLAADELVELSAPGLRDLVWPGVMRWHNNNGRTSMLACAVKVGDQPVGVLGMGFRSSVNMTHSQRELIRALANHLALAVHLDRLSRQANSAALLNERNRIARDIHDSLAQNFTGMLMQLQAANRFSEKNPEIARACVARAETLARTGLKEARRSVMSLVNDEEHYQDIGLALRSLVETATADTGTRAAVTVSGEVRTLHPLTAVNLLRVCQEALGNAQRYARAKQITIDLVFTPHAVRLAVEDDGIGFVLADVSGSGFGLAGMRERAERINGALTIDSIPGKGTRIVLEGPFNKPTEVQH
jgi:signal transduction histidine kinase